MCEETWQKTGVEVWWRKNVGDDPLLHISAGRRKIRPVTGRSGVKKAVADGSDQMPQPQMQAMHFGR